MTGTASLVRNEYPTSDGRPMAETDWHRILMAVLIETLDMWYADQPMVYVSSNLLVFYVPGDKRRHVSPDVFVVVGVPKLRRPNYLIWEEGKSPSLVIELTSSSTRKEDTDKKFHLYQDVLKVQKYFLFDPRGDYLEPSMQGYRLRAGKYVPIRPVHQRLPSQVLGLHLERDDEDLRLWNPATSAWLPTPTEMIAEEQETAARELARRTQAEAEVERLRRELEKLRGLNGK